MAKSREPYVEGHRIDSSVSTTVSDSKVSVYVGIEADTGTYDLTYQQVPKYFVQEYSTKSKPDANDSSTLLHAGKLLESNGIYVKRVNRDSILPGIVNSTKTGEVAYFDSKYNKINKLTQFYFEPKVNEVTDQKLAIFIDNIVYVNSNVIPDPEVVGETYTSVFLGLFKSAPKYCTEEGYKDITAATGNLETALTSAMATPNLVVPCVDGSDNVLFEIINVGPNNYSVESFLESVADIARNRRSTVDGSEFIDYDPTNRVISMDIQDSMANGEYSVQPSDLLIHTKKNSNALTKVTFFDGSKFGLSKKPYVSDKDSETNSAFGGYLDIGSYRYYPAVTDNPYQYGGSNITEMMSAFGNVPMTKATCMQSDALIACMDSLVTSNESVKPDSTHCSTELVFKVKLVGEESAENQMIIIPSFDDGAGKTGKTEVFGFNSTDDVSLYMLTIKQATSAGGTPTYEWVPIEEVEVDNYLNYIIEDTSYLKIKFDGELSDVSSKTCGIKICTAEYVQNSTLSDEGTEEAASGDKVVTLPYNNYKTLVYGTNLSKLTGLYNYTLHNLSTASNLGTLYSIINDGNFEKVNGKSADYDVTMSVLNQLTMYFRNTRNITLGITNYDSKLYKKSTSINLIDFRFASQDKVTNGSTDNFCVLIDGTLYHTGVIGSGEGEWEPDPTEIKKPIDNKVQVTTGKVTANEFLTALTSKLYNSFSLFAVLDNGQYLYGNTFKNEIETSGNLCAREFVVDQTGIDAKYAIIQKFTSAKPLSYFSLTFDETDNEIIKFVNCYNGTEYNDTISFNVSKMDGYGTNISYKSYNLFDGRSFFIKVLNEDAPVTEITVDSFGGEIKPKKATGTDYCNALSDLVTEEFKPSFLWDAGLCDQGYINKMTELAETTYSMVPISVPNYESAAEIKAWKSAYTPNYCVQYVLDGWYYNTVFSDISFECCPTYYYLVNILANSNSISREFQPMFYKTRGVVGAGIPVRNIALTKDEREELLDSRINSIVRNKADNLTYINMNLTNQLVESAFSEEQNVRISNEVCRSADSYADNNIISKNNTSNLRAQVTSELTNILRSRILDSRGDDTAASFYVECNDVNNPQNIIDARKLAIDIYVTYNKSIKAVLIYSRTKSLNG